MFVDNFTPIYYRMFAPILIWAGVLGWRWLKTPELGEQVYDLALALVAPLGTDNHTSSHVEELRLKMTRATDPVWVKKARPRLVETVG